MEEKEMKLFVVMVVLMAVLMAVAFSAHAENITLNFDPVAGATGYRIEMNSTMECVVNNCKRRST
jgi:hypothetical protein